jgi:hypothetical protein
MNTRSAARWTAGGLLVSAGLLWVAPSLALADPPIADPGAIQPPGTGMVTTILGWIKWIALVVCIGSLIWGGAKVALSKRRGEGEEAAKAVGMPIIGAFIVSAAFTLIGFLWS